MRRRYSAEEIMLRMGFPETEDGHYVTLFRAMIAREVECGMVDHSYGTWAGDISCEERAKMFLALDWARRRGHQCRVELIDRLTWRRFWRRKDKVEMLAAWTRDGVRRAVVSFRVWRDKYVLRLRNPYY